MIMANPNVKIIVARSMKNALIFVFGLLVGVGITLGVLMHLSNASNYKVIESSLVAEEDAGDVSRLILQGKTESGPTVILTRDAKDHSLKRCGIVDRNGDAVNVFFKHGLFIELDVDKLDSQKLLATDYGVDGRYDLRIEGQKAEVLKDGRRLDGKLREGGGVVVESDGVRYRIKSTDMGLEFLPIKE